MQGRFTVLASGSSGNASLLQVGEFGLLIDCGLGPRVLTERLGVIGLTWKTVSAVLLTHTHRDHWNALTLAHLRRLNIPLIAHPAHHDQLASRREYDPLYRAGLTRDYAEGAPLELAGSLRCHPVPVPHDADPTFAFRIEWTDAASGSGWVLGFASDVGHCTPALIEMFRGVDVLAVEYNHDVKMQRASGRPPILINRVLGDHGHLSNVQAAELTRTVARSAGPQGLRGLIQLHLSRDCNRPEIAAQAGRAVLDVEAPQATLVTANQFTPTPTLPLTPRRQITPSPRLATVRSRTSFQPSLPGFEGPSSVRS